MTDVTVIYPGSFDPITHGHTDIIRRATKCFDKIIVAVTKNTAKNSLFSIDERVSMAKEVLQEFGNVSVTSFDGLLVNLAKELNAKFILRSLRNTMDVTWELQLAMMNRKMVPEVETLFMAPSEEYNSISASLVREIALNHGDVLPFVDECVAEKLNKKIK